MLNAPLGLFGGTFDLIHYGHLRLVFVPRLMLPLSCDHRVVDGAAGARFTSYLAKMLGDIRRLML